MKQQIRIAAMMNRTKQAAMITMATLLCMVFKYNTCSGHGIDSSFALILKTNLLQSYPPLTTDMPYDVMIGYIYFDSIRKQPLYDISAFISSMTYSDTLKQALKYYYEMDNYDPIRFQIYNHSMALDGTYRVPGGWILAKLMQHVAQILPDTQRTYMLVKSDVIAHIRAIDISVKYDTSGKMGFYRHDIVHFEILDSVKGCSLPSCINENYKNHDIKNNSLILNSNCMEFSYSPSEPLTTTGLGDVSFIIDSMVDNNGNPWIKKDSEYIAFLSVFIVGGDSTGCYYALAPAKWHTTQGGLYPIINGFVLDPHNDFGFGANMTVSSYLTALRSRVYSIEHP